jgi:hypothetical protein
MGGDSVRDHGMGGDVAPPSPTTPSGLTGGSRRRRNRNRRRSLSKKGRKSKSRKSMKGGIGLLETAAVPVGLFALQRFFKGSQRTKKDVRRFGKSVKRTFRRFRR